MQENADKAVTEQFSELFFSTMARIDEKWMATIKSKVALM
jgi:uncharacterized protein (DUF924 family)